MTDQRHRWEIEVEDVVLRSARPHRNAGFARKNIFNNRLGTPALRPKSGNSAGVFGAEFLAAE